VHYIRLTSCVAVHLLTLFCPWPQVVHNASQLPDLLAAATDAAGAALLHVLETSVAEMRTQLAAQETAAAAAVAAVNSTSHGEVAEVRTALEGVATKVVAGEERADALSRRLDEATTAADTEAKAVRELLRGEGEARAAAVAALREEAEAAAGASRSALAAVETELRRANESAAEGAAAVWALAEVRPRPIKSCARALSYRFCCIPIAIACRW
jgi:hypothetical protein